MQKKLILGQIYPILELEEYDEEEEVNVQGVTLAGKSTCNTSCHETPSPQCVSCKTVLHADLRAT